MNSVSTHPLNDWSTLGVLAAIDKQPTADVAPVVHAHWIEDAGQSAKRIEKIYYCSACEYFDAWGEEERYDYCPNCGARMDEREET